MEKECSRVLREGRMLSISSEKKKEELKGIKYHKYQTCRSCGRTKAEKCGDPRCRESKDDVVDSFVYKLS